MKYKIRNFFRKLQKGFSWGIFMFKSTPWTEYDELLRVIERQLLRMVSEFERTDITMSSAQDAKRMRLAAKLLKMYREEHYMSKYYDEGRILKENDDFNTPLEWREGYSSKEWVTLNKDDKALSLAFKIIAQCLPGWWQ